MYFNEKKLDFWKEIMALYEQSKWSTSLHQRTITPQA